MMRFTKFSRDPALFQKGTEIEVRRPPALPTTSPAPMLTRLLPVLTVLAMAGMMAFYFRSANPASRSPMFVMFPVMMMVSVLSTVVFGSRGNRRHGEVDADRHEYLRYLAAMTDCIERAAGQQFERAHRDHPAPEYLWHLIGSEAMWQRCSGEPDFGVVRVGIGVVPMNDRLVAEADDPDGRDDPVTSEARDRLLQEYARIAGMPVTVAVARHRRMQVTGAGAGGLVRALLCQLTVWHGPDQIRVATLAAGDEWEWLKWLPHHHRSGRTGDAALRFDDAASLENAVHAMTGCHVVVIDSSGSGLTERDGITVIELAGAAQGPTLTVVDGTLIMAGISGAPNEVVADDISIAQSLMCARRIAKYELVESYSGASSDWLSLAGFGEVAEIEPVRAWAGRTSHDFLRVPVGVTESGAPIYIDLKETARQGMGPHGLCIGATGSGKSEFLRTLTLGLISSHSPTELNLILVDFKGGATFLGFDQLRHVSAVITNLAQEAHLVARMRDALAGELTRRQEVLRAAGNLGNVDQYRHAYAAGTVTEPLPALFIVVDEFSELLSQYPDFAELFLAIGRLGRSLGIHLLLASQRLEEGKLRGLESHLSYRICLKTFSAAESRTVLGVPDAHDLPGVPGSAYLKTVDGQLTRFRAAFVSAPAARAVDLRPRPFTGMPAGIPAVSDEPTVLRAVVDRLSGLGPRAHQVWLPPLDGPPTLSELLRDRGGDNGPSMCAPIGLVDNSFAQRRDVMAVDLRGAGGHVAIVGGPRSGKSTALQTVLLALAATHGADRLNIYGIDLGHGALVAMRELPHVGAVAPRSDPELVHRIIAQLLWLIRHRQGGNAGAPDEFGEVILAIDGVAALRRDFPDLEDSVISIAALGLSVGVHVILTSMRWSDLRPALKDQLGSRIELRLGDPAESELDRRRAQLLVGRPAGHGINREGQEFVIALPRADISDDGQRAPRIEVLPALVGLDSLLAEAHHAIGVAADGDRCFGLAHSGEPFAIILGDNGCGKTTALRAWCRSITASPGDARVTVVDYRRTLLGVVESPHLADYAMSSSTADAAVASLCRELSGRMPGPGITQRQLRDRSWWSGPQHHVVVDDYDLVAGIAGNPLLPLLDFLPYARDIGLHVVIARRSGGASRAMFDPLLARMRDLGASALLMSAEAEEGVLMGGVRSAPRPPGRAVFTRRGAPDRVVQIGWSEPP